MHTDAASLSDFCDTATEHVFVCLGPTVDGTRPCLAACRTKIEQAHLWILICVYLYTPNKRSEDGFLLALYRVAINK